MSTLPPPPPPGDRPPPPPMPQPPGGSPGSAAAPPPPTATPAAPRPAPPPTAPGQPGPPQGPPPGYGPPPTGPTWPAGALPHGGHPPAAGTQQGNLALALVGGIAGAFVAGVAWWGVVATTEAQFVYAAFAVGWVVAQAVLIVGQQPNRVPLQAIAGTFTLLALALSEYFIQRTLFIKEYGDRLDGVGVDVPLWEGFGVARETVYEALKEDPLTGLFWVGAVVAAVVVAGTSEAVTRRS